MVNLFCIKWYVLLIWNCVCYLSDYWGSLVNFVLQWININDGSDEPMHLEMVWKWTNYIIYPESKITEASNDNWIPTERCNNEPSVWFLTINLNSLHLTTKPRLNPIETVFNQYSHGYCRIKSHDQQNVWSSSL